MKKIICMLMAIVMLLSLVACGKDDVPETTPDTEPAVTEAVVSPSPIEEALKSEDTQVVNLAKLDDYEAFIRSMGFGEFRADYWRPTADSEVAITLKDLTFNGEVFKLEFDYTGWDAATDGTYEDNGWILYGTKSDGPKNISEYNDENMPNVDILDMNELFPDTSDYRHVVDYTLFDVQDEVMTDVVVVSAVYYPATGNLYNLVKVYGELPESYAAPRVLFEDEEDVSIFGVKNSELEIVDGYPVEMAEFTINYGDKTETYKYRVGMSLSNWAASELNTGDWVNGYANGVFSPEYDYVIYGADNDMRYLMDDAVITALETNYEATGMIVTPEHMYSILHDNIRTPTGIAHLVDYKTPLLTNGFRVVGKYDGSSDYQMFDIGSVYSASESLEIYMNNIDDSLIPDIKVYALKEPMELIDMLAEGGGYSSHIHPFAADDEKLTIPETAYCMTVERVPEANENAPVKTNAVVATYDMSADPNFDPHNENVFAVTYQGKLVYWIHMPIFASEVIANEIPDEMTEEEYNEMMATIEPADGVSHEDHQH